MLADSGEKKPATATRIVIHLREDLLNAEYGSIAMSSARGSSENLRGSDFSFLTEES